MKNTTQNSKRGHNGMQSMKHGCLFFQEIAPFKILHNYKTFLITDLQYKIDILTLVTYQMMHTWGNAIFQKGVCLFHLNLKKLLPLCTTPLPHCRQNLK